MFLISKLIAKEWFKSLFGAIVVLFLLVTVADIVNGFLRNYDTQRVLIEYITKLPGIMGKMLPVSGLLASLFAINKLKSNSELTAVLAGGYSIARIILLISGLSIVVFLIQFINLGFIEPNATKIKRQYIEKSRKSESKYLARSRIGKEGYLWYKASNYFASFKAFDKRNKALKIFSLYEYNDDKQISQIIKATAAVYKEGSKWTLENARVFNYLSGRAFPKMERHKDLTYDLDEVPEDFGQFEADITTLDVNELGQFIERLKSTEINSEQYEIMYYEKFALAFICIVFALFPLSGLYNPNRRASSFGKGVVTTLIFTVAYFMAYSWFVSLGNSGKIPTFVATMGIPTLTLLFILLNFHRHRKL